MPNRRVQAVLNGCGGMGMDWCNVVAAHPDAEIIAIVEPSTNVRVETKKRLGLAENAAYDNLAAALSNTIADFVIDCSPPSAHAATTTIALSNGFHVLGEKPIAPTVKDARDILALVGKTKRIYMINQNYRWHPSVQAIKRFLQSKSLGNVQSINILYSQNFAFADTFRYRVQHPFLLDMAIHHFDLVRYLTESQCISVYCVESCPSESPFQAGSSATAVLQLSNGTVCTYQGSWSEYGHFTDFMGKWRITCDKGVVVWNGIDDPILEPAGDNRNLQKELSSMSGIHARTFFKQLHTTLDKFILAVHSGKQPETWCGDNIYTLAMVLDAIQSSRENRIITRELHSISLLP